MTEVLNQAWDHVLRLQPGASGTLKFRYPIDIRTSLDVRLVSLDGAAGIAELAVEHLGRDYDALQIVAGLHPKWNQISPGLDGEVHFSLNLHAGESFTIESDEKLAHSIRLTQADWKENSLNLTFRESS